MIQILLTKIKNLSSSIMNDCIYLGIYIQLETRVKYTHTI